MENLIILILFFVSISYQKYTDILQRNSFVSLFESNYTNFIPCKKPTFILFYTNHHFMRNKANLIEKVLSELNQINEYAYNFYKINGPYNFEIITKFIELEEYPTLAYFHPGEIKITDIYKGKWTLENLRNWIFILRGHMINDTSTNPIKNDKKTEYQEINETNKIIELLQEKNSNQQVRIDFWQILYNSGIGIFIGILLAYIRQLRKNNYEKL